MGCANSPAKRRYELRRARKAAIEAGLQLTLRRGSAPAGLAVTPGIHLRLALKPARNAACRNEGRFA
jgi:hypothetical protein